MKYELELTYSEYKRKRGFIIIEADTAEEAEQKFHDTDPVVEWEDTTDERLNPEVVIENIRSIGENTK